VRPAFARGRRRVRACDGEQSTILLIGAFAGGVGYFFGSILPTVLGALAVGG